MKRLAFFLIALLAVEVRAATVGVECEGRWSPMKNRGGSRCPCDLASC